ncbi:hypothetical protein ACFV6Z_18965 [Streptomyces sp. NPDC059818]|uniref:hypothetical protein n=1 Tax=Streptomyces sp. NPDC059818 TaxID=3346962 RepID=UPI003664BCEE
MPAPALMIVEVTTICHTCDISLEGATRLIEATGWTGGTTDRFLALPVELNAGIERLEGLNGTRAR